MSYRVVHLTLKPYPAPTATTAIDYACGVAAGFGAKLNVTSPRLRVHPPKHALGGAMVRGIAREFEVEVAAKSAALESYVQEKGRSLGLDVSITQVVASWPVAADDMTWRGRASDLCVVGLPQAGGEDRLDVEDWLFGLGRPCLLYLESRSDVCGWDSALVCWDASKSAARAVSDALPILKLAKNVQILTVKGEKKISLEDTKAPILDYLGAHDVKAGFIEAELAERSIGRTILNEADKAGASLIVMGAYGHSRLKEFVLGGATKEMLNTTTIPLLMAH